MESISKMVLNVLTDNIHKIQKESQNLFCGLQKISQ